MSRLNVTGAPALPAPGERRGADLAESTPIAKALADRTMAQAARHPRQFIPDPRCSIPLP